MSAIFVYRPYLLDPEDPEWKLEGPLYSGAELARAWAEGGGAWRCSTKDGFTWSQSGRDNAFLLHREELGDSPVAGVQEIRTRA